MRRPTTYWQDEIIDDDRLEELDEGIEKFEEIVCRCTESLGCGVEGETPEYLAKTIGYMVYQSGETDEDIGSPVESMDGNEGKKLAFGYIGVKGMERSGIGIASTAPEHPEEST